MAPRGEGKAKKPQMRKPGGGGGGGRGGGGGQGGGGGGGKGPLPPHKPFKKPRKDAAELPSSLLIADDDPDFPRGGGSVLSRKEAAEARAEAEVEFEREGRSKGKKKKKKKGTRRSFGEADEDFGSLFGEGVTGKLPRFPNRITLKGSESNVLSTIVSVGQLVPCVVLQVDDDKKDGKGNKRIWLSLRLSLLSTSHQIRFALKFVCFIVKILDIQTKSVDLGNKQ